MQDENNVGCLVILKRMMSGPIPVGIITERDIVKIIGSTNLFIGRATIREFSVISIDYNQL